MSLDRPEGAGAVMASRANGEVETDDALQALYRKLEYFPTPPWAARAGAELIRFVDPEARTVREPACGEGHMAAALGEYFETVHSSDIHPFGYGDVADFLDEAEDGPEADWIATNPPFPTAAQFLRLGLRRARRGVALLLRLQFLEGVGRHRLLHGAEPLTVAGVFAERVPMTLGRWDPEASTATGYAWFLFMKGASPRPLIGIPPGTKARLTRPDDARRFGWRSEAGLLEAMEAVDVVSAPVPRCPMCDDTGFKDHAALQLDPCGCGAGA